VVSPCQNEVNSARFGELFQGRPAMVFFLPPSY